MVGIGVGTAFSVKVRAESEETIFMVETAWYV